MEENGEEWREMGMLQDPEAPRFFRPFGEPSVKKS